MAHPIVVPKLGQMTEESTIVRWLKREGESVKKGDVLFEMETDKAVMEVESFYEGTLLKIVVPPGVAVPVMAVVGFVGRVGDALPPIEVPAEAPSGRPLAESGAAAARFKPSAPPDSVPSAPTPPGSPATPPGDRSPGPLRATAGGERPDRLRISPRAARLARRCLVDARSISGSGPGGRVVERDVRNHLDARGYHSLRIGPAAKELARREGIDVLSLEGTGRGGRILAEDVRRAVAERPRPLSPTRRVIARRLTESYTTTPHFFVTVSVDMTDLESLRGRLKLEGKSVTVGDFLVWAAARTLAEFPDVNSVSDGESVWRRGRVHVGVAVALEAGLVVPVIRDADRLTLAEIHRRAGDLAARARAGKLEPAEMRGGTFTISNMGMLGVENFTAIINPGEGAILAAASIVPRPVVREDAIAVRSMMKMTLSADHRLIDGALAARFVNRLKERLEKPMEWS
jgi:pyruvate dehydrogenase E2 component (dihydrolipoamide acetyltransferase)